MCDFLGRDGGAAYPETVSLYAPASSSAQDRLRPATPDNAPLRAQWDLQPHVFPCLTDDPEAEIAFGGMKWREELAVQSGVGIYCITEADGRPIGVMQIVDPHLEPRFYWGEIEPNLGVIEIWVGPPDALGKSFGTQMMTLTLEGSIAVQDVTAVVVDPLISNGAAHRFYQRLGFTAVGQPMFDADDCLVHRLSCETWESRTRA